MRTFRALFPVSGSVVIGVMTLAGCAVPGPAAPPPTPHFVFDVPSTAPSQKPPMPIAILQAKSTGTLFVETVYGPPNTPRPNFDPPGQAIAC